MSSCRSGGISTEMRLADDLVGRVPEHALGRAVPGRDDPVERFRDDGVVGRFDDGGETPRVRFELGDVSVLVHVGFMSIPTRPIGQAREKRDGPVLQSGGLWRADCKTTASGRNTMSARFVSTHDSPSRDPRDHKVKPSTETSSAVRSCAASASPIAGRADSSSTSCTSLWIEPRPEPALRPFGGHPSPNHSFQRLKAFVPSRTRKLPTPIDGAGARPSLEVAEQTDEDDDRNRDPQQPQQNGSHVLVAPVCRRLAGDCGHDQTKSRRRPPNMAA